MIGFTFDGIKRTIQLPLVKSSKTYICETDHILRQKSVPLKDLQTLVGKL